MASLTTHLLHLSPQRPPGASVGRAHRSGLNVVLCAPSGHWTMAVVRRERGHGRHPWARPTGSPVGVSVAW